MAVLPEYRGQGVGTSLLFRLMNSVEDVYENISLSVVAGNPAMRLYQKLGFEEVGAQGNSVTMRRKLQVS